MSNYKRSKMSEHDLKTGLMPRIQALIAPPSSTPIQATSSRRRNSDKNHKMCDYCKEGGNLLCCDRCPASFHLICAEPPLEDIPEGDWICRRCRWIIEDHEKRLMQEDNDKERIAQQHRHCKQNECMSGGGSDKEKGLIMTSSSSATTTTTISSTTTTRQPLTTIHATRLASGSKNVSTKYSPPSSSSSSSRQQHIKVKEETMSEIKKVWKSLMYVSTRIQSSEFCLPPDLLHQVPLPGFPRMGYGLNGLPDASQQIPSARPVRTVRNQNGNPSSSSGAATSTSTSSLANQRTITRDPSGLIPLPIKTCFFCCKSCQDQALISCDFCSALFHSDCLTPPLTTVPSHTTRWMCPLHPEPLLEQKLLSKTSEEEEETDYPLVSQRLLLKTSFSGKSVSQVSITDFIGRIRQQDMVRTGFRHLLTAAQTAMDKESDIESTVSQVLEGMVSDVSTTEELVSPAKQEDQELWIQCVMQFQKQVPSVKRKSAKKSEAKKLLKRLDTTTVQALALQRLKDLLHEDGHSLEDTRKMLDQEKQEDDNKIRRRMSKCQPVKVVFQPTQPSRFPNQLTLTHNSLGRTVYTAPLVVKNHSMTPMEKNIEKNM